MRRRSLFAPIFLMALGALMLAANLRSDLPVGRMFADYWPWILVVWGGFCAFEHIVAGVLGRRGPRPMGVGTVLLTILLCIVGSLSHAFYHSDHDWRRFLPESHEFFGEDFEFPVAEQWELPGATSLELSGLRGTMRVSGVDGNAVKLSGKRRVRALDRESAEAAQEEIEMRFSHGDSKASLEFLHHRRGPGSRVREDLTLGVPRSFDLMIRDSSGDLRVADLAGGLNFDGSGQLRLAAIAGPVELQMRSSRRVEGSNLGSSFHLEGSSRRVELAQVAGSVDISGNLFANLELAQIEGPTSLKMRRTVVSVHRLHGRFEVDGSRIELDGASGAVQLESKGTRQIRLQDVSGTSRITSERGKIEIEPAATSDTHAEIERGNIEVTLSPNRPFQLEASVRNGDIVNLLADDSETSKGPLQLSGAGPGGPRIRLEVGRGNVTLKPSQ